MLSIQTTGHRVRDEDSSCFLNLGYLLTSPCEYFSVYFPFFSINPFISLICRTLGVHVN